MWFTRRRLLEWNTSAEANAEQPRRSQLEHPLDVGRSLVATAIAIGLARLTTGALSLAAPIFVSMVCFARDRLADQPVAGGARKQV